MSPRIVFIERAEKGEKIAALCREYGISRTAGRCQLPTPDDTPDSSLPTPNFTSLLREDLVAPLLRGGAGRR